MCGIAGLIGARPVEPRLLQRMTDAISHRGPDDEGMWIDQEAGVGLGHRRLSIIDLSPSGHQPMLSADGRLVLTYNGEIYNHADLRRQIEAAGGGPKAGGAGWRGYSDTETLLEAIAFWGLEPTLHKCVGMFAFALWDRRSRTLRLARDRFGEKPLYYGWAAGSFLFASELKAIRIHPGFDNAVSREALRLLASRTYIPAPLSIYENIYKLEPGCILTASEGVAGAPQAIAPSVGASGSIRIDRYWSYRDAIAAGIADPLSDENDALERLDAVLGSAIAGQSVADVPVGTFLSGGIDSSTVVGLLQKHGRGDVRTFSIGFEEAGFNEATYAKDVARHFGTEHNELYVTVDACQEVVPLLAQMYDEPFGDSSQIPTYLVSKFAREQVTVALSGDGGDELFGGYNRYFRTAKLWSVFSKLPEPARALAGNAMGRLPPSAWNRLLALLPRDQRQPHFGTKVQKAFRTMGASHGLDDVFASFLDEWFGRPSPVLSRQGRRSSGFDLDIGVAAPDAVRMMYCDATSYLPDDILCKVDRASMACSLETRVPFLDHRVAELAARIPIGMKIRGGKGKHILRQLLYREAPASLFDRPKAGFGIPVGAWIRGPLRDWAEDLLDTRRMKSEGFFDPATVHERWRDHLSGTSDATPAIWSVLMFQAWQRSAAGASQAQAEVQHELA